MFPRWTTLDGRGARPPARERPNFEDGGVSPNTNVSPLRNLLDSYMSIGTLHASQVWFGQLAKMHHYCTLYTVPLCFGKFWEVLGSIGGLSNGGLSIGGFED